MKRYAWALVGIAVVATLVAPNVVTAVPAAAASKGCADAEPSTTDWASFGRDLTNSRNQTATSIGVKNVGSLKPAWALDSSQDNRVGQFQTTPIEAGGCMFATTSTGSIFATDARTGEIVWSTYEASEGAAGGLFAPAQVGGILYAIVGRSGVPYVIALDASTGTEIWNTPLYQDLENAELHAAFQASSVVVYNGMVFVALAGTDSFSLSHPAFFILKAKDGSVLKRTTVIPQDKWLDGYAGGGIWATAVVDNRTGFLYVGTSNPYNKRREYKYTNAIIKVDLNRKSKKFGEIVDSYRGDKDYDPKLYNTPQCEYLGEAQPIWYSGFCGQKDVDFGASPSLYKNSKGDTIVVELQKSCTVHAVHADTMERLWKRPTLAAGGASGCAGGTAYDNHAVYVSVNEGTMFALDKDTGKTLWKTSYKDPGSNYHPATVANGVVYTIGNNGHLYAFNNKTGKILFKKQLNVGGEACTGTQSSGVSVVGNTVYIECDTTTGGTGASAVYAYRLP
jgi:alcohol dehydrogenase (cytochrome c)